VVVSFFLYLVSYVCMSPCRDVCRYVFFVYLACVVVVVVCMSCFFTSCVLSFFIASVISSVRYFCMAVFPDVVIPFTVHVCIAYFVMYLFRVLGHVSIVICLCMRSLFTSVFFIYFYIYIYIYVGVFMCAVLYLLGAY